MDLRLPYLGIIGAKPAVWIISATPVFLAWYILLPLDDRSDLRRCYSVSNQLHTPSEVALSSGLRLVHLGSTALSCTGQALIKPPNLELRQILPMSHALLHAIGRS